MQSKQRYIRNKKNVLERTKKWRIEHRELFRTYSRKSSAKKRNTPKGKLNDAISSGISDSISKGIKAGRHWEDLVGYTSDQLKKYLEKRFKSKMCWDNYGGYWEIDHIIPISVFNFEKPEDIDFKRCWNLKNLQPLQISENRSKHNKINKPFQAALMI